MDRTVDFPGTRLAPTRQAGAELPALPTPFTLTSRRRRLWWHCFFIGLPFLVVSLYLLFNAADRYEASSDFTVQPLVQPGAAGLAAHDAAHLANLTQPAAPGAYDAYIVIDYLQSPDALKELETKIGFLKRYRGKTTDLLYRPEPWRILLRQAYSGRKLDIPFEDQVGYFNQMVQLSYSMNENIVTLDVQAFSPDDAVLIAKTLLDMGEDFINRTNIRVLIDMVQSAEEQVKLDETRLNQDHVRIRDWREGNDDLDPDQLTALVTQVIQGLENNLVAARAVLMQDSFAADSPVRRAAELRVAALTDQIAKEQQHLATMERAFASKYYEFNRLKEDIDFAKSAYESDLAAVQTLHALAEQQEIYLQRIYEPHRPDKPAYPQWWLILPLTLLGGAMGYGVIRMVMALGREKWVR